MTAAMGMPMVVALVAVIVAWHAHHCGRIVMERPGSSK